MSCVPIERLPHHAYRAHGAMHAHGGHGHGRMRGRGCGPGRGGDRGGFLEPAVLAVLASGEAHGYGVAKAIDEMTSGCVCADPGGIYRILRRLEEDSFVVSDWVEGEAGPQRRSYMLTGDGRELLRAWVLRLRDRARVSDDVAAAAEEALAGAGESK